MIVCSRKLGYGAGSAHLTLNEVVGVGGVSRKLGYGAGAAHLVPFGVVGVGVSGESK